MRVDHRAARKKACVHGGTGFLLSPRSRGAKETFGETLRRESVSYKSLGGGFFGVELGVGGSIFKGKVV